MSSTVTEVAAPDQAGQRVRSLSWGGNVRQWMVGLSGTVERINKAGNPVIVLDHDERHTPHGVRYLVAGSVFETVPAVADTYGCFRRIGDDGSWIRTDTAVLR